MLKKLLRHALRTLLLIHTAHSFAADESFVIHAARLFDGNSLKTNTSVLIENGKITQIASRDSFKDTKAQVLDLGDATLLPAFIELHAHLTYQHIPADVVLQHGIGTLRDVGGNVHTPVGGDGQLRVLSSGLIITADNGYPIPNMGANNIAIPVSNEAQTRKAVQDAIAGGAVIIKIALEPGNEYGAPWNAGHHHGHQEAHSETPHDKHAPHQPHGKHQAPAHDKPATMPLLSENIVKAVVDEAHKLGRKVTAHVAENQGVTIALNAGVDEWAHTPCDVIHEDLLKQAVKQQVTMISTLDTLSKCSGVTENVRTFVKLGGKLLYGSEVAHPDIPWGIDAQELNLMMHYAQLSPLEVLQSATAKAGQYLNLPVGTIQQGVTADLIAIDGDATKNFKPLEYPKLVMSGGKIIVNRFTH
ncbi:hypothetical protein DOJK_02290 [Patescibacteria group bacterium]|nr:hypothetical protein DOJK_02290 [Patescibacteria group bacterium]